jgi:hypothetical protein
MQNRFLGWDRQLGKKEREETHVCHYNAQPLHQFHAAFYVFISYVQQTVHDEPRAKFPTHCVESAPVQGSRHPGCACVSLEVIIEMVRLRMPRRRSITLIVVTIYLVRRWEKQKSVLQIYKYTL